MKLFVYGTLRAPRIWEAVTGLSFDQCVRAPAQLRGYRIAKVTGGQFPGIAKSGNPSETVGGQLMEGFTKAAMERLDSYEDAFYDRVELEVALVSDDSDERAVSAWAYVIPESLASAVLSPDRWDFEEFMASDYDAYFRAHFG